MEMRVAFSTREVLSTTRALQINNPQTSLGCMQCAVLFFAHHRKVFDTIVVLISIPVMYDLTSVQKPIKSELHHDSMFQNVSVLGCIRMLWTSSIDIVALADKFLDFQI